VYDPGMRVRLPGTVGVPSTYFVRIRSASTNVNASGAGLTSGPYQLQVRLREAQEFSGSTVNFADIRYAMNGVRLRGLPGESPLIGEAAEDEDVSARNGEFFANNGVATGGGIAPGFLPGGFGTRVGEQVGNRPQYIGNILETAKGAISVAGNISNAQDVDFYVFDVTQEDIVGSLAGGHASVVFDLDYADGLNRPDTSLNIFRETPSQFGIQYTLVYTSDGSNVADDQGRPLSIADVADFTRGSTGTRDAYIGPVALPEGRYVVGVSSVAFQPRAKIVSTPTIRPINSIRRIVDEAYITGVSTAVPPVVEDILATNTIGATGELVAVKTFGLGGYSSADLPALYLDYTLAAGNDLSVIIREAGGRELTVASSTFLGLVNLRTGTNSVKVPLDTVLAGLTGGGVNTVGFAGQDDLTIIFRGSAGTTIDGLIVGFAERGESVGSGAEALLLDNPFNLVNITNRAGQDVPPFVRGAPGSWVTTRQFSLATYEQIRDRPQAAFNYEVLNGQMDVFVIDDATGFQTWVATTVAQNRPQNVLLLTTGSPQTAVVDISGFADTFFQQGRTQLRLDFRARNDDPSRARVSNVHIQLANGSRVGSGEGNSTYTDVPVSSTAVVTGKYQLEVRLGDNFFSSSSFGIPTLTKTFDTNDRLAEQITLVAPTGANLRDGDRFTLSDGGTTITFEFTLDGTVGLSNVAIPFTSVDADFVVARAIRNAINSTAVQSRFQGNIRAATSSGIESGTVGRDPKINLHGSASFATVSATLPTGEVDVIYHQGVADRNVRREQGQVVIQNSFIRESRDYAIFSEPAARLQDPRDVIDVFTRQLMQEKPNLVGTQAVRNLLQPNDSVQGGLVPGVVVQNNLLEEGGLGGVMVQGETPIWMLSPFIVPYFVTGTDPFMFSADYTPFVNNAGPNPPPSHFGHYLDDDDTFIIDADRTRIRLEFDDLAGGNTGLPVGGSGQVEGDGYRLDSSVGYYRDTGGSFYQRSTGGNLQPFATNAVETSHALRDAINASILVSNGTTHTIRATIAESLLGPDPFAAPTSISIGYPEYFNRPAVYLEGVTNINFVNGPVGYAANPFDTRQIPLGETPQPQARIVNNTVIGKDGRASFNSEPATRDTNDTLATATQTWQGTAHNPLSYNGAGRIGDNGTTTDVDIYQFKLGVGDLD
jgi:hypothetical protein